MMSPRDHDRLAKAVALAACLLAAACGPAHSDFARPEDHDLRDIALIYRGRQRRTAADLLPLVAYVDPAGRPRDWLFDAALLLPARPFADFTGRTPLTLRDWQRWLDALFGPAGMVEALGGAIQRATAALGPPPRRLQVIVSLGDPGPPRPERSFGDLDGDGRPEPLATDADRLRAIEWLADQVLERWRGAQTAGMRLWGFYWYPEAVRARDEPLVRRLAAAIHARGYKLLWIPWFRAPGWEKWRELGFDLAVMQPNYAFLPPLPGGALPDDQRLCEAADLARSHGMGVEIETRYALDARPYDRALLRLYLNHAISDGYARAVRAHFFSFDQYIRLARSQLREARQLYDDLYALHRGRLRIRPLSALAGGTARLASPPGRQDVSWLLDERSAATVAELDAGSRLIIALPKPRDLAELRVRLAPNSRRPPRAIDIYGRAAGDDEWSFICSVTGLPRGACGRLLATWPPRPLRELRLVPLLFPGSTCRISAVVSYPGPAAASREPPRDVPGGRRLVNAALGRPYAVWPAHERLYPDNGGELTDGVLTRRGFPDGRTVGWHQTGRVAVTVDLGRAAKVQAVRVHAQGGGAGAVRWPRAIWADVSPDGRHWRLLTDRAPTRLVNYRRRTAGGLTELGWLELKADRPEPASRVRVTMVPDGWLMLSELQVVSGGENIAAGRPYTLRPLPSGRSPYADDGLRLTDAVAVPDFRRCVGWRGRRAAIVVDLGRPTAVEAVGVYVLGGGAGAVYFPADVEVRLADGLAGASLAELAAAPPGSPPWSRPLPAMPPPADETGRLLDAWAVAQTGGRPARYVRIDLTGRRGWLMVGEVQVWARR